MIRPLWVLISVFTRRGQAVVAWVANACIYKCVPLLHSSLRLSGSTREEVLR